MAENRTPWRMFLLGVAVVPVALMVAQTGADRLATVVLLAACLVATTAPLFGHGRWQRKVVLCFAALVLLGLELVVIGLILVMLTGPPPPD